MDEKISSFIEDLRRKLEGLPQEEVREALSYYEEYLSDAAEAGKDIDEILRHLNSPEKIAGMIKTEASIIKAQQSPGLRNFNSVMKNAFLYAKTPINILFLSIFTAISYSMVVAFFAGAFAAFVAAVATAVVLAAEALAIPTRFRLEITGTLGAAFFSAGICLLLACGLYMIGRLLIKATAKLISRMLKKPGKLMPESESDLPHKKPGSKGTVIVSLALSATGLALFSVSGLPLRYFTIFNSMKPDNIAVRTFESDPAGISKISAVTAHSHIKLVRNTTDRIIITYEQPDWLDYEVGTSGSMLSFYEKSNGRLPLFKLSTLHESRTELTVSIPEGYTPEIITLESTGGHVFVDGVMQNISVKTYTGSIHLSAKENSENYNLKISAENGIIEAGGSIAGRKTGKGTEYYLDKRSGKTIELYSSRGNISID